MRKKDKKIFGIGVNDCPDPVTRTERVDGKKKIVWKCPYYTVWHSMLNRCYCPKFQSRNPTYIGCSVFPEWFYFMTFKAWMMTQDWQNKALDKDILFKGNRIYSPKTCRFVDKRLNAFLLDGETCRGEYPIGVYWREDKGKFHSQCKNPFTKTTEFLGYFKTPEEGHEKWRKRKHELALIWADLQEDEDIAKVLRDRFAPKDE